MRRTSKQYTDRTEHLVEARGTRRMKARLRHLKQEKEQLRLRLIWANNRRIILRDTMFNEFLRQGEF